MRTRSVGLGAQMETLPYEANFIDLDPVKKDDLGVPVIRLTFDVYDNENKMAAYLTEKMSPSSRPRAPERPGVVGTRR